MPRVSVTAIKKPANLTTFKFLRRDEGRLSYAQNIPDTPSSKGAENSNTVHERRDSRSLREAIAYDMRNAKSHDPLGEVVVAVPKKAVPPARSSGLVEKRPDPPQRRSLSHGPSSRRPQWVDPEIPARSSETIHARHGKDQVGPSDVVEMPHSKELSSERMPYNESDNPSYPSRRGRDGLGPPYGGSAPRRVASVPPQHIDPMYPEYDRNYFRVSPSVLREHHVSSVNRSQEEENLMFELEQEIRAVQEERSRYRYSKSQLDRERQRFEAYKYDTQQKFDEERANLDALRAQDERDARKDLKTIEERYRNISLLLSKEREANKRLSLENEALHAQLEELTHTMRETQAANKAEMARLRRDVDSLARRNSELLVMAKEEQIKNLVTLTLKPELIAPATERSLVSTQTDSSEVRGANPSEYVLKNVEPPGTISEEEETLSQSSLDATRAAHPVVFDFSPETPNAAARQRRAKMLEQRMQRQEEERQQRRVLREQEVAKRRLIEQEEAASRAREESNVQRAKETLWARMRQEEAGSLPGKKQTQKTERRVSQCGSVPPIDALKQRKAAEHPLHTPRVVGRSKNAVAAKPVAVAVKPKSQIVTRDDLLRDTEPRPDENYPEDEVVSQSAESNSPNKREVVYRSGKKVIHYANGTVKVILPSQHIILHFTNGDVKCTFPSGKSTYWYDNAQTTHTQLPNGVQLFEFCTTGQCERHMPDGTKEIVYPDGVYKIIHSDGSDETHFPEQA